MAEPKDQVITVSVKANVTYPIRFRVGTVVAPINPGLEYSQEEIFKKQVLNQLAFKVPATKDRPAGFAYPNRNGNDELTEKELTNFVSSPTLEGSPWPAGRREEFAAMLSPDNPSPLVEFNPKKSDAQLEIQSYMPKLYAERGDDAAALKARELVMNASFYKVESNYGNRYVKLGDGQKTTIGELKEFYNHPDMEGHWPGTLQQAIGLRISRALKNLPLNVGARLEYLSGANVEALKILTNDPKRYEISDSDKELIDAALAKSMADKEHDGHETNSFAAYANKLRHDGAGSTPRITPDPVLPEEELDKKAITAKQAEDARKAQKKYKVVDSENRNGIVNVSKDTTPTPKELAAIATIAPVTVPAKITPARNEGESVEDYMARVEFLNESIVQVGPLSINLNRNGDTVVSNKEVMDSLNSQVRDARGQYHQLRDFLPQPEKERLTELANNTTVEPASLERLKEVMHTKVFDVKEGASNFALLNLMDVDKDGKVTVGEMQYKRLQQENAPQVTTAQVDTTPKR